MIIKNNIKPIDRSRYGLIKLFNRSKIIIKARMFIEIETKTTTIK
tara:strand:+ start:749 stop:883 length:135 start_codon:yes stop_codon:yes gene_type:complete